MKKIDIKKAELKNGNLVLSKNEFVVTFGEEVVLLNDTEENCGILLINNNSRLLMCIDETTDVKEAIDALLQNIDYESIAVIILGINCDKVKPNLIHNMLVENEVSTIKHCLTNAGDSIILCKNDFSILDEKGTVKQYYSLCNQVRTRLN